MAIGWRGQYYRYRELSLNLLTIYKQRSDLQAFLEIILSLSTLIIFSVFALKPTALTMIALTKEISEKRDTLASLNQKITDLQTANNIYIENQSRILSIDNVIFTQPKPDVISKQIMGLAARNNIEIKGLSIGQLTVLGPNTVPKDTSEIKPLPAGAQTINAAITVSGSYEGVNKFLNEFENLRIPIKIDSVTLSNSIINPGVVVELVTVRIPYIGQD